jgi:hypothetical protein
MKTPPAKSPENIALESISRGGRPVLAQSCQKGAAARMQKDAMGKNGHQAEGGEAGKPPAPKFRFAA